MARFFIHRPVFAWVLAIVTMLAGVWAVLGLPMLYLSWQMMRGGLPWLPQMLGRRSLDIVHFRTVVAELAGEVTARALTRAISVTKTTVCGRPPATFT